MSYSFERIGKLLEERELRVAALQKVADKSWSLTDGARFLVTEAGGVQAGVTHDQALRKRRPARF